MMGMILSHLHCEQWLLVLTGLCTQKIIFGQVNCQWASSESLEDMLVLPGEVSGLDFCEG